MQAMIITGVGETALGEIPEPVPAADEILLEVRHVGLCGSDMNTWLGMNPLVKLPRVPGHEIGGVVLEAGSEVPEALLETFSIGQRALVIPYTTCGSCSACRVGRVNACRFNRTLGVQQDGGMTARIAVRADRLIANDSLPPTHLALVEPLSVGFHAVERGRIDADEIVVVLGGGMIGVGAMVAAVARGARVIAVEPSVAKHPMLIKLGVERVLNPADEHMEDAIGRLTGDHGADVVIEAVGLPQTFRQAIDLAGFAGRVVYVGYAKQEVSYNTSLFNLKELDIHGSRNAVRADFERVIDWLESHETLASGLITRIFPMEQAAGALKWWHETRQEAFKVIVEMPA